MKLNFIKKLSVTMALFVMAGSFGASATVAVVAADAYIAKTSPANNFGKLTSLSVGGGKIALIRFNMPALPDGTTGEEAAAAVVKATMLLWVNKFGTVGTVDILTVTSAWSETGLTFKSMPAFGATLKTLPIIAASQYIEVDVTDQVRS